MKVCCPVCKEEDDIMRMLECEVVNIKGQPYRSCFYRCANCTKRFAVESEYGK